MKELSILSERLKQLRIREGKNQDDFAESVEVAKQTYASYETGRAKPPLNTLRAIAETYGISVDWLLGLSDRMSLFGKMETYRDLFLTFSDIENAMYGAEIAEWNTSFLWKHSSGCETIETKAIGLGSYDDIVLNYFHNWKEIKDLHDQGKITDDLYSLWIANEVNKVEGKILEPF